MAKKRENLCERQTEIESLPPRGRERVREKSDELHDNELCYTATEHSLVTVPQSRSELNGLQQMFGDYDHTELRSSLGLQIFAKRLQFWIFCNSLF